MARTPTSGQYEERCFGATGSGLWVKFIDSEFVEWCGVFGGGLTGATKLLEEPDNDVVFVLNRGQGYWINARSRELVSKTRHEDIQDAIWPSERPYVVTARYSNISLVEPADVIWTSDNFALDGIKFSCSNSRKLMGTADGTSGRRFKFEFYFDSREFKGASKIW